MATNRRGKIHNIRRGAWSLRLAVWLRRWRRKGSKFFRANPGVVVMGIVVITGMIVYKDTMTTKIDPAAYAPLLDTIAKGESNGNYNAYYGNAANTAIRFTQMPVSDVLQWQKQYVDQGSPSSAVGKYQIVRPTLTGLVRELAIPPETRFDANLQDRLAIALLERRGAVAFVEKELSREQFAANLAKEWAALPRVLGANSAESYYAADGLNKSQISIAEVYSAIAALEKHKGD